MRLLTDNELTQTVKAILAEGEVDKDKKTIEDDSVLKLSVESEPNAIEPKGFELVREDIMEVGELSSRYSASMD